MRLTISPARYARIRETLPTPEDMAEWRTWAVFAALSRAFDLPPLLTLASALHLLQLEWLANRGLISAQIESSAFVPDDLAVERDASGNVVAVHRLED